MNFGFRYDKLIPCAKIKKIKSHLHKSITNDCYTYNNITISFNGYNCRLWIYNRFNNSYLSLNCFSVMGQSGSNMNGHSYKGTSNTSRRSSFRSPFIKRKKHRKQLSATFSYPNTDNCDKLNINIASIEQVSKLLYLRSDYYEILIGN